MKYILLTLTAFIVGFFLNVNAQNFNTEIDEFTDQKLLLDEDWRVLYRDPECRSNQPCYSILQVQPAYIPDPDHDLIMLNFLSISEEIKYNFDPSFSLRIDKSKLFDIEAIINGKNRKTVQAGNYKREMSNDLSTFLETFTILIEYDDLLTLNPNNDLKFRIKSNVIEFKKDDKEYLKEFVSYVINNR